MLVLILIMPFCMGSVAVESTQIKDCSEDSSEIYCRDPAQDSYWNLKYPKRPDADKHEKKDICYLRDIPVKCSCKDGTAVQCANAGLTQIPEKIPQGTTSLDLSSNSIHQIAAGSFLNLTNLTEILMIKNNMKALTPNSFSCCPNLRSIYLHGNKIRAIEPEAFSVSNKINDIVLDHNSLEILEPSMFANLHELNKLYLNNNLIHTIHAGSFNANRLLQILFLTGNRISYVDATMFSGLHNLTHLHLSANVITDIYEDSFMSLNNLESLSLSMNRLSHIKKAVFNGLDKLTFLDLRENRIWLIDTDAFQSLPMLQSLNLRQNNFRSLSRDSIVKVSSLEYVYFDEFYMCSYAPQVVLCEPRGDGISSHQNLLENVFLRVCVWVVAIMACVGNTLVLLGRFLLREDNQVHSFYIKNLSLADMLMGVYLIVIGSRDIMYRGKYLQNDEKWRNSLECDFCGFLSTLSSEVSVLTISLITLDRYVSIAYPFYLRKRNITLAYGAMLTIWVVCIVLAVLPLSGISYFGDSFYKDNGVCVPLHLHNPFTRGWEYSTFLFLGLNLILFIFISYAYIVMFIEIRKSTTILNSTNTCQEKSFIKRFFSIVITDFACWMPIIVIKIITLAGVRVSGELYGWIVVFLLPVNSALNPLLYTLTTRLFKEKLLPAFCIFIRRGRKKATTNTHARNTDQSRQTGQNKGDNHLLAAHTLVTCCAAEKQPHTDKGSYQLVKVTIFLKGLPQ